MFKDQHWNCDNISRIQKVLLPFCYWPVNLTICESNDKIDYIKKIPCVKDLFIIKTISTIFFLLKHRFYILTALQHGIILYLRIKVKQITLTGTFLINNQ